MKSIFTLFTFFAFSISLYAQDTVAPVVSNFFSKDTIYLQVLSPFNDLIPDFKVTDAVDGDVTQLAYFNKKVDSTERSPQLITFIAPDKSGNIASKKLVVQTIDTIAPILSLKGDSIILLKVNESYFEFGWNIIENYKICCHESETDIDTSTIGRYYFTHVVTDYYGNQDCVTRTVCVGLNAAACKSFGVKRFCRKPENNIAPKISNFWTQDTVMIGVFTDFESQIPNYSITDDVDGDITSTAIVGHNVNEDSVGFYNFTLSAKDQSANSVSKSVLVHVADTTAPTIKLNGPKWVFVPFGDEYTDPGFVVTDNYSAAEDITVNVAGDFYNSKTQGRFCLSAVAKDDSGNQSELAYRVICVALDSVACAALPGGICDGVKTSNGEFVQAEMDIYPNPGNGLFHVSSKTEIDLIEVYNTKGQLILSSTSSDLKLGETGIYLVTVRSKKGAIWTQTLMVK